MKVVDYASNARESISIYIIRIAMQTVRHMLMSYIVKVLIPESPAYGNTLPFVKEETLGHSIASLEPCDIIFTKTNSSWYQLCRRFLGIKYDHVCVVINKNQVIHVSPPIISKLELPYMLTASREPLAVRLQLTAQQKQGILSTLNGFLGEKYNESAIPTMFKNELISRLFQAQKDHGFNFQNCKYSKICTEAILYAFGRGHPGLQEGLQQFVQQNTGFKRLGYIMPDEVLAYFQQHKCEIVFKSPQAPQPTYLQKFQHGFESALDKIWPIVKLPSSIANSQALTIVSQIGKRTSDLILKDHPLVKIVNIAILVFQLKYGNKFSKILLMETVITVLILLRVVPDQHLLRDMFRRMAKL